MEDRQVPGAAEAGGRIRAIAPNRIAVGKREVALGLLWQPANPELALREQARIAEEQAGASISTRVIPVPGRLDLVQPVMT